MMLTGLGIRAEIDIGRIRVTPYEPDNVGPCSLDLRLGPQLLGYQNTKYVLDPRAENPTVEIPPRVHTRPDGTNGIEWDLAPGVLYLAHTVERVHTDLYAAMVHGRSSLGRLGIVVHQTAGFVDVGFDGQITLEITVVHEVVVFAGMRIAQLTFHPVVGKIQLYKGKYQGAQGVEASRSYLDKEMKK